MKSEQNLIFLCCNCHKIIDTEVAAYPVDKLFDLKSKHEAWVVKSLAESSVYYAELQVLTSYLVEDNGSHQIPDDYTLLKISDKIQKNSLSDVQNYINMGLSNVATIEDYLNRHPDPRFAFRLTGSMAEKYKGLKEQRLDPVDIFYTLWEISCGGNNDFNFKAAGLGILVYFLKSARYLRNDYA